MTAEFLRVLYLLFQDSIRVRVKNKKKKNNASLVLFSNPERKREATKANTSDYFERLCRTLRQLRIRNDTLRDQLQTLAIV